MGIFPAATVAWRLEQEDFIKDYSWINQLKLRAGYGETGSQSIDPYSTFSSYGTQFTNTPQGAEKPAQGATGSGDKLIGLVVDKMENDGLKWERTVSYNVGVDFSFLSGSNRRYCRLVFQEDERFADTTRSSTINWL